MYHIWTLNSIEINSILSKNSSHLNVGGFVWFKEQSKGCTWGETARNQDRIWVGQHIDGAWVTGTFPPVVPCRPSRHTLQSKEHTSWVQLRPYWDNLKLSKVLFLLLHCLSKEASVLQEDWHHCKRNARRVSVQILSSKNGLDAHFRGKTMKAEAWRFFSYFKEEKRGFCESKGKALKELSVKYIHQQRLEREQSCYRVFYEENQLILDVQMLKSSLKS